MAIKLTLLVIAALIAVAAAIPYDFLARPQALSCNPNAVHSVTIGTHKYDLIGCSTDAGAPCINGLPTQECTYTPGQCYLLTWYSGTFEWAVKICQRPFGAGHCYIRVVLENCQALSFLQDEITIEPPTPPVEICLIIDDKEECRPLHENAPQGSDCFCIEDLKTGDEACVPEGCKAAKG